MLLLYYLTLLALFSRFLCSFLFSCVYRTHIFFFSKVGIWYYFCLASFAHHKMHYKAVPQAQLHWVWGYVKKQVVELALLWTFPSLMSISSQLMKQPWTSPKWWCLQGVASVSPPSVFWAPEHCFWVEKNICIICRHTVEH